MELKVSIKKQGGLFKGDPGKTVQDNLIAAMYEVTQLMEREVKSRTPIGIYGDKGGLRASIAGDVVSKGSPVVKGIVATDKSYAEFVEQGTGLYGPYHKEFTISPVNKKALFWAGAKHPWGKVVQKGFEGRWMFKKSLDEEWPEIQRIFESYGFKMARELS